MKKALAFLLTGIMALSMAACGGSGSAAPAQPAAGTESSAGIRGTREQDLGTEAGERGEGAGGIGQGPGRCLGTGARGQRWGGRMQPGSRPARSGARGPERHCCGGARVNFAL